MKKLIIGFIAILSLSGSLFAQTWTATVLKSGIYADSSFQVVVALSDGTTTVNKEYFIQPSADPLSDLVARVQSDISLQSNVKTKASAISTGPLTLPAPKAPPSAPQPPDASMTAFISALQVLKQTQKAVDLGFYKAGGSEITAAQADASAKFQAAYLSLL